MTKTRPNKPARTKSAGTPKTKKRELKAKRPGNSRAGSAAPVSPGQGSRPTKASQCLALLRRGDGASLHELMTATGWQSHSVRGFLSGAVKRKLGLTVTSSVGPDNVRRYRVATGEA